MLTTAIAPPAFDPQAAGCFFQNGAWVLVPGGPTLAEAQKTQCALMDSAYAAANTQPVAYMATTFQADDTSVSLMAKTLAVLSALGGTTGVTWYDANNAGVAMTYAQFAGLGAAIFQRGDGYFTHLQAQKALIRAATNVAAVGAIVW